MCDSLVLMQNATADGSIIFGKNSDRDPNEAHAIQYIPRTIHEKGELIHCQYIDIPVERAEETFSVILSKPSWLKIGSEMGANEFGVVMGNEAVFTKEKYTREALLGMDLLTLSLQRSKTAQEALSITTDLIEKWGQGGVASRNKPTFIYHNSFIIADLNEAWILETADKFWVAKKVHDIAAISNGLTIQNEWDLASPGLIENAINKGYCESKSEFNFKECYSDPQLREVTQCVQRQERMINGLLDKKGAISVSTILDILRSHDRTPFKPDKGTMASICGHYNLQTIHQTTGSYVASLTKDFHVHWLTGTSSPCLSVFKPFFFEDPEPLQQLIIPTLTNDDKSLWWKHEKLHRLALMDYPNRAPLIIEKSRKLEQQLMKEITNIKENVEKIDKNAIKMKLGHISSLALTKNFTLIESLIKEISKMKIGKVPRKSYSEFWTRLSEKDGIKLT